MALDPRKYDLDNAIGVIWDDESVLDSVSKNLIFKCLPDEGLDRPHGEDQLDTLHLSMSACEFLLALGDENYHWLSDMGKNFPQAVRKFIYNVACTFHHSDCSLPEDFIEAFAGFLTTTKSHIATLNYDNLLYSPLISRRVCAGYDGVLVDGFTNRTGFRDDNLERRYGNDFGYYLHLHGSPLFVDQDSKIIKLSQGDVGCIDSSNHVVLTHIAHKTAVISSSSLLMAYWNRLAQAITESEEIILFGYSGADEHLNQTIKNYGSEKKVVVVEWAGSGEKHERQEFWDQTIGSSVCLIQMESILRFQDWSAV